MFDDFLYIHLYVVLMRVVYSLHCRYKREFLSSGLVKAINSAVQFLPAVLISRILKLTNKLQAGSHPTAASKDLILLAIVLFAVLSLKTLIENMYFDMVTNLSSQVRGTLSAAIYQKALRLGPEGRQNTTVSFWYETDMSEGVNKSCVAVDVAYSWERSSITCKLIPHGLNMSRVAFIRYGMGSFRFVCWCVGVCVCDIK